MIRASVAMVTYNGENYVREQIESILASMGEQDELIVSDDGSTDRTVEIVKEYEEKDTRISVIKGPGKGVKQNVGCALAACKGKYIFLADQDDIWGKGKIDKIIRAFMETGCGVVVHDAVVINGDNGEVLCDSFYSIKHSGAGAVKNIWRNTYVGCCMAFQKDLLEYVLPIPDTIEMHDQWIGVINDARGTGACFLTDKLLYYRRHGKNTSSMRHYGIKRMISNRIAFLKALGKRLRELKE